jgi:hypothetical protein
MAPVHSLTDRATDSAARRAARPVILLTLALALTACGGGSSDAGSGAGAVVTPPPGGSAPPSTPPPGGTTPPPPIQLPPIQPPPVQPRPDSTIAPIGAALPEPLPDSDYDGIPDHLDAFPFEAPLVTTPGSVNWMRVEGVWTEIQGRSVPDAVVAGHDLLLSGRGLGGSGEWAVFDTRRGKVAVRPEIVSPGTWKVAAPPLALGVHAVVGNRRSETVLLSYVEPGAPVLFPPSGPALAGTSLQLEGLNLEGVDAITLGSALLSVEASGPGFVRVTLPASSDGNELRAKAGGWLSNPLSLDYRRTVSFTIDRSLPLAPGMALRIHHDRNYVSLEAGATMTLEVPAHLPSRRHLDLVGPFGQLVYDALGVVFWPGQAHADLTLDSTIAADLLGLWPMLAYASGTDWQAQRTMIAAALAYPEGTAFRDALVEVLRSGGAYSRHELTTRLLAAIDRDALAASTEPDILADGPVVGTGPLLRTDRLSDQKITVIGLGSEANAVAGIAEYSQYTVTRAKDESCSPIGLPTNVSPADVCIKNGTKLPSSAAVYVPRRFNAFSYTPNPADQRRSHIGGVLDPRRFGQGPAIMTDDAGNGLCGMQTCYVEIITGGLGLGADGVSLTPSQQRIVRDLRSRWILDAYVIPLAKSWLDLPDNQAFNCVFDAFIEDQDGFVKAVDNFVERARAPGSSALTEFNKTVGQYFADTLQGLRNISTANKLFDCAIQSGGPSADDLIRRTKQFFGNAPKLLGTAMLFVNVVDLTMDAGGIVFTPEKMIFRVAHNVEITGLSPFILDLNDAYESDGSERVVRIEGNWLANTSADASPAEAFLPARLRFSDRRGVTRPFTVREEDVVLRANPVREIVLSLPELGFFNPQVPQPQNPLSGLEPGPLQMWLEYEHPAFECSITNLRNYPDCLLKVPAPVPVELVTPPRINAFDPPVVSPGETIRASGYGLDRYSARPNVVLVENVPGGEEWQGGVIPAKVERGKLVFSVPECGAPSGCVPPGQWRVNLYDGLGEIAEVVVSESVFGTGFDSLYVTLADFSSTDDKMLLLLLDENGTELQRKALPDFIGERNITLQVDEPQKLSAVQVVCLDPGADATCTYDVIGGNFGFQVGASIVGAWSGQLPKCNEPDTFDGCETILLQVVAD